jgi:hypothetical protein
MCTDFIVSYYLSVVYQCRIFRHSVISGFFTSFTQSALICNIFFHNFSVEVVCSNYLILNCQIIPSVSPFISHTSAIGMTIPFAPKFLPFYLPLFMQPFIFSLFLSTPSYEVSYSRSFISKIFLEIFDCL